MTRRLLPFLGWLPLVNRGTIRDDTMAGLTGAIVVLPQGVAFATIAGMPPETGLYAAPLALVAYAVFGTSRQLAVGPVAIVSLLLARLDEGLVDDRAVRTGEDAVRAGCDGVRAPGEELPAGKYGIHMIPSEKDWVVIFSKVNDSWGSYSYNQDKEFYSFLRTLGSYEKAIQGNGRMIISTDSDFFKYLKKAK